MFSRLVAALLLSSPPIARYGLPSTISCVAFPCFCRWGTPAGACATTVASGAATDVFWAAETASCAAQATVKDATHSSTANEDVNFIRISRHLLPIPWICFYRFRRTGG